MATKKVKLQSSDGELFEVEIDVIKWSKTIKTMLERLRVEEDEGELWDNEFWNVDHDISFKWILAVNALKFPDLLKTYYSSETIPLPRVNAAILKKVIAWCQYQKSYPPPMEGDDNKEKRADDISLWDNEFWNVDHDTFFDLILAAVDLEIPDLSNVLRRHFCEQFYKMEAQSDHGRSACCSCGLESINEHLSTHKIP